MKRLATRIAVTLIALAAALNGAAAQSPNPTAKRPGPRAAPQVVTESSGYCVSGSAGFLVSEEQGVEASRATCKRGDTIIIPAARTRIIARLCDFARSIVTAEVNVVCVLTGVDRAER